MNRADVLIIGAVVVLLIGAAVLAMAEAAFLRMSRIRALALEEEGHRGAARLARLLEHPEATLNTVLLVHLVCSLTAASLVGLLAERLFGVYGFVAAIVVEIVVFFVLAEVAPKTYAIQHTDIAALRLSPLMAFLTRFRPLSLISRGLIGLANVLLPGKGLRQGPYVSEEEIRQMADVAASEDVIETEERRLIHAIFEFGDTVVREVMVPRPDMLIVDAASSVDEAVDHLLARGYSRAPVSKDDADNIVGIVYLKDLVRRLKEGKGSTNIRRLARDAKFVPEQVRVSDLLRDMQREKFHMAIAVDEYGGTAGLVTLEDLLEEIVGEITDEYDVERPELERLDGGALRVAGSMSIDDVNEVLGVELPDDEWDTVGGLMFNLLGHVPVEGESVQYRGITFRAEKVQRRRIVTVHIEPPAHAEAAPATTE
jgi:CBS domain containing-hemolysin-like protein